MLQEMSSDFQGRPLNLPHRTSPLAHSPALAALQRLPARPHLPLIPHFPCPLRTPCERKSGTCAAGAEDREGLPGWGLLIPGPRRRHLLHAEVSSARTEPATARFPAFLRVPCLTPCYPSCAVGIDLGRRKSLFLAGIRRGSSWWASWAPPPSLPPSPPPPLPRRRAPQGALFPPPLPPHWDFDP